MAREKFQTLTEQMFYILIALLDECCGVDIMEKVERITNGRVSVGPGTLYSLLNSFEKEGMIEETMVNGRKRSYKITVSGRELLESEFQRLKLLIADYQEINNRK
ncbi:PadR family transcriptional regulator [Anaerosacchariphilus polymeriproducens]|uniref:PadR family transcriptional regulator n=1 Tax=Anaerosacchariphilus polymeriproducens TaxID=1812858 RepID=A0A371AYC2_9FIRM|nr:PadR family transcriptional regulator [Anaerosacchariphilus polymeriproducens]RDU24563.1 PadR family transcriptional regulator [Anaerosacchariphilus polymeriproducens]